MLSTTTTTFFNQVSTDETFVRSRVNDRVQIFNLYKLNDPFIVGAVLQIEPLEESEPSRPCINMSSADDHSHAIGHTGGD